MTSHKENTCFRQQPNQRQKTWFGFGFFFSPSPFAFALLCWLACCLLKKATIRPTLLKYSFNRWLLLHAIDLLAPWAAIKKLGTGANSPHYVESKKNKNKKTTTTTKTFNGADEIHPTSIHHPYFRWQSDSHLSIITPSDDKLTLIHPSDDNLISFIHHHSFRWQSDCHSSIIIPFRLTIWSHSSIHHYSFRWQSDCYPSISTPSDDNLTSSISFSFLLSPFSLLTKIHYQHLISRFFFKKNLINFFFGWYFSPNFLIY